MSTQTDVDPLIEAEAEGILADALASATSARLSHYREVGTEETRKRLRALLDVTSASIRTRDVAPVVAYAEEVARSRFAEGFRLQELQTAVNVLEEAIWNRIVSRLPPSEMAEALGLVSTVLGIAKDWFGSTFVALATEGARTSLDLRSLFRGTQGF